MTEQRKHNGAVTSNPNMNVYWAASAKCWRLGCHNEAGRGLYCPPCSDALAALARLEVDAINRTVARKLRRRYWRACRRAGEMLLATLSLVSLLVLAAYFLAGL